MINDPWQFCLKYILKVKEINDIDKKPSYAEFGNLVHNTLQHCKLGTTSDAILTEIFDQYAKKRKVILSSVNFSKYKIHRTYY